MSKPNDQVSRFHLNFEIDVADVSLSECGNYFNVPMHQRGTLTFGSNTTVAIISKRPGKAQGLNLICPTKQGSARYAKEQGKAQAASGFKPSDHM